MNCSRAHDAFCNSTRSETPRLKAAVRPVDSSILHRQTRTFVHYLFTNEVSREQACHIGSMHRLFEKPAQDVPSIHCRQVCIALCTSNNPVLSAAFEPQSRPGVSEVVNVRRTSQVWPGLSLSLLIICLLISTSCYLLSGALYCFRGFEREDAR